MTNEQKTYKQKLDSFVSGLENKLTDVVILAAWTVMENNARQDKKCKGLKRSASSKCCAYCMSHEGTYTSEQVDTGAMGGRHEACKCKVTPVFEITAKNKAKKRENTMSEQARSAKIERAKISADIEVLGITQETSSEVFKESLDAMKKVNKNGGAVDTHSIEELSTFKKFLSDDKMCGVAVKPDGDITCVFKNPKSKHKRSAIYDLMITAKENGGVKLDCYKIDLVNKYERCGFKPVARVLYDEKYVDKSNLWALENKPDVYFMMKTDDDVFQVLEKIKTKTYKQSTI